VTYRICSHFAEICSSVCLKWQTQILAAHPHSAELRMKITAVMNHAADAKIFFSGNETS